MLASREGFLEEVTLACASGGGRTWALREGGEQVACCSPLPARLWPVAPVRTTAFCQRRDEACLWASGWLRGGASPGPQARVALRALGKWTATWAGQSRARRNSLRR